MLALNRQPPTILVVVTASVPHSWLTLRALHMCTVPRSLGMQVSFACVEHSPLLRTLSKNMPLVDPTPFKSLNKYNSAEMCLSIASEVTWAAHLSVTSSCVVSPPATFSVSLKMPNTTMRGSLFVHCYSSRTWISFWHSGCLSGTIRKKKIQRTAFMRRKLGREQ